MGGQKNEGGLSGGSGGGGDPASGQEAPSRPASAEERSGQPEDAGAGSKSGDIANGTQHNGSVPKDGGKHEKPVSEMTEAEKQEAEAAVFGSSGNGSAKASSAPDGAEEQAEPKQPADFADRSAEERKKAFDSLFGEGQADPATGRPIRQSNAAQRGSVPKRPVPPPRPKQGSDRK